MTVSDPASSEPHVLIIGAGLTGLILAHGLDKHGIKYDIFDDFEAAGSYALREWTMGIHWSYETLVNLLPEQLSSRLVSEAAVDKSLDYSSAPYNGFVMYDGKSGDVLAEVPSEGTLLRVSRRKLRTLLSEGINVKYNHRLARLEYSDDGTSVVGHFANGAQYTGTVICGADGWRSAVRGELFGPEKAKATPMSGVVHMSAAFSYRDAKIAQHVRSGHPVFSFEVHPDLFCFVSIQDAPDPAAPADWSFYLLLGWLGEKDATLSNAQRLALVKQKAASIAEPFRTAVQAVPDDVVMTYSDINSWTAQVWDTHGGRVVLAGDAAHPMPPYRGQGLNNAIQDVHNFIQTMVKLQTRESDAATAMVEQTKLLDEYTAEVVKRCVEETELSTQIAYGMLKYDDFARAAQLGIGRNAH